MARQFGHTWWGRAWVDALENRARLDPNRLPRGRTYARYDRVSSLHLARGEITAKVRGNRPGAYRVVVRVHTYGDAEWKRVVETVAGRAAHAAALLDGELDPSIADDAAASGVDLLPGPGDLQPRCSCPDWADPCKHAAAVCYLVADVLDADPFALFELRGRSRNSLMAELRAERRSGSEHQNPASSSGAATIAVDDGEVARDVWSAWQQSGPTDVDAPTRVVPARPGVPASWPTDPPDDAPFTATGLQSLAGDAAQRAWMQLRGEGTAALDLDAHADLARRGAELLGKTPAFAALARTAGVKPVDLARRSIAWRHGGTAALTMLDAPTWRPPDATMANAREAVAAALPDSARVTVRSNRITVGTLQLRLDEAGCWWRFEKRRGRWEISAQPADDADDLIDIGTPDRGNGS